MLQEDTWPGEQAEEALRAIEADSAVETVSDSWQRCVADYQVWPAGRHDKSVKNVPMRADSFKTPLRPSWHYRIVTAYLGWRTIARKSYRQDIRNVVSAAEPIAVFSGYGRTFRAF